MLIQEIPLPQQFKDHNLSGNKKGRRECHVQPDWLLIYRKSETVISFERTGTHSDLF
jgi:mRNA interferase YafQ